MRLLICLLCCSLWPSTLFAQRLHMPDLFHCLRSSADQFETCMFRHGFTCYKGTGGLSGWTCLFAYQSTPLTPDPANALALVQYDRNSRSDILIYQVRSKEQYNQLRKELIHLGYRLDPTVTDREFFISSRSAVTTVNCYPAMTSTGLSGNYQGYIFTLTHRRY